LPGPHCDRRQWARFAFVTFSVSDPRSFRPFFRDRHEVLLDLLEEFKRSIFVIENTDVSVAAALFMGRLAYPLHQRVIRPGQGACRAVVGIVGVYCGSRGLRQRHRDSVRALGNVTYEESWITRMFFFKKIRVSVGRTTLGQAWLLPKLRAPLRRYSALVEVDLMVG